MGVVKTAARCRGVPGALSHSHTQCMVCEVTTGSEVRVPDPSPELTEVPSSNRSLWLFWDAICLSKDKAAKSHTDCSRWAWIYYLNIYISTQWNHLTQCCLSWNRNDFEVDVSLFMMTHLISMHAWGGLSAQQDEIKHMVLIKMGLSFINRLLIPESLNLNVVFNEANLLWFIPALPVWTRYTKQA